MTTKTITGIYLILNPLYVVQFMNIIMISPFSSFGFRGSIPPSRINTDKRDFEMRHRKVKYSFCPDFWQIWDSQYKLSLCWESKFIIYGPYHVNHIKMTILYGSILYETYRGVRKIKPFACERDFYVHEFIRMKHASRHLITLKSFEIIRLKHWMDRKCFKRMIW